MKTTEFNPAFLCIYCEKPVEELSVGGSAVCPWCDSGYHRDGTKWTYREMVKLFENGRRRIESDDKARAAGGGP